MNVLEAAKENWSLGHGLVQFASGRSTLASEFVSKDKSAAGDQPTKSEVRIVSALPLIATE